MQVIEGNATCLIRYQLLSVLSPGLIGVKQSWPVETTVAVIVTSCFFIAVTSLLWTTGRFSGSKGRANTGNDNGDHLSSAAATIGKSH